MGYDATGLSVCSRLGQPPIEVVVVWLGIKGRSVERNMGRRGRAQSLEDSLGGGDLVRGQLVDQLVQSVA